MRKVYKTREQEKQKVNGKVKFYKDSVNVAFNGEKNRKCYSGAVYTLSWNELRNRIEELHMKMYGKKLGPTKVLAFTVTETGVNVHEEGVFPAVDGPLTVPIKNRR